MSGPKVAQLSIDQLLDEYGEAAVIHRTASHEGDHKKANRAYRRLTGVIRELRRRGRDAQAALLRLLDDERVEVRAWAATHALEFAPDRAELVLEEIASGPKSLEEFEAGLVLQEWRAGRLQPP